jgi:hypothetical protein
LAVEAAALRDVRSEHLGQIVSKREAALCRKRAFLREHLCA